MGAHGHCAQQKCAGAQKVHGTTGQSEITATEPTAVAGPHTNFGDHIAGRQLGLRVCNAAGDGANTFARAGDLKRYD